MHSQLLILTRDDQRQSEELESTLTKTQVASGIKVDVFGWVSQANIGLCHPLRPCPLRGLSNFVRHTHICIYIHTWNYILRHLWNLILIYPHLANFLQQLTWKTSTNRIIEIHWFTTIQIRCDQTYYTPKLCKISLSIGICPHIN